MPACDQGSSDCNRSLVDSLIVPCSAPDCCSVIWGMLADMTIFGRYPNALRWVLPAGLQQAWEQHACANRKWQFCRCSPLELPALACTPRPRLSAACWEPPPSAPPPSLWPSAKSVRWQQARGRRMLVGIQHRDGCCSGRSRLWRQQGKAGEAMRSWEKRSMRGSRCSAELQLPEALQEG